MDSDVNLNLEEFAEAIKNSKVLIEHAVMGNLRVPDFVSLVDIITEVYE